MPQRKLTILIILVLVGIFSFFILPGHIPHETFDSNKWKTADLNTENNFKLRWDMMNSLRNSHELVGMTKIGIEQLLGKPDETIKNTSSYYLGYTGAGINTGTLYISFNENQKVTTIRVWQG